MHDLLFVFLFSSVPHGIRALGSRNPRTPTALASQLGSRRLLPSRGWALQRRFFVLPLATVSRFVLESTFKNLSRAVYCPRNFSPWNLSPSTVCRVRGICRHHHHLSRPLLAPSVGNLSRPLLGGISFSASRPLQRKYPLSGISSQRKYFLLAESSPDGISSSSASEISSP